MTGRAQYGPGVHAKAALAVCAHYLPVARAAKLVAALTGVKVSAGFVAGVRGRAAGRPGPFMDRVRELLHAAGVLYAGETPARVAGKLHDVHVACTQFLTAMHTGDRTSEAIDAGGILPGYAGTIVRAGCKGYEHLTGALHAWCGSVSSHLCEQGQLLSFCYITAGSFRRPGQAGTRSGKVTANAFMAAFQPYVPVPRCPLSRTSPSPSIWRPVIFLIPR